MQTQTGQRPIRSILFVPADPKASADVEPIVELIGQVREARIFLIFGRDRRGEQRVEECHGRTLRGQCADTLILQRFFVRIEESRHPQKRSLIGRSETELLREALEIDLEIERRQP